MRKFYSSWHVHSTQSPTGIELWEGYNSQPLYSRKIANSLSILAMVFVARFKSLTRVLQYEEILSI
jgi:hypothetical protein